MHNDQANLEANEAKLQSAKHARLVDAEMESLESAQNDNKRPKKMVAGVVAVILAVLLGVGIVGWSYYSGLKSNVSYDGDVDALRGVLSDSSYEEPFYLLVVGSDNWRGWGARSDAMILARVDLSTPQVTMVSIPRDTPYEIDGQTVKLNEVYSQQGEVGCIQAVSEVAGVDITHYIEVEFDQLESVVDELGGVSVEVPYAFDYEVYTHDLPVVHVDAGAQTLTGEQAVAFVRMRVAYEDSTLEQDAIRQANVRALAVGIIKQVLSAPPAKMPSLVMTLLDMVQTDIPVATLVSWATKVAAADEFVLYSCTGPTEGSIDPETGLWLTYATEDDWSKLMTVVDSGADPSSALDQPTTDGVVDLNTVEVVVSE